MVNHSEVQWSSLTLGEPPSWSWLTPEPGKYARQRPKKRSNRPHLKQLTLSTLKKLSLNDTQLEGLKCKYQNIISIRSKEYSLNIVFQVSWTTFWPTFLFWPIWSSSLSDKIETLTLQTERANDNPSCLIHAMTLRFRQSFN